MNLFFADNPEWYTVNWKIIYFNDIMTKSMQK